MSGSAAALGAAPGRAAPIRAIPGFRTSLGITLLWAASIVVIPLLALLLRPLELGPLGLWESLTEPRVLAALRLSFGAAFVAALLDLPLGLLLAWAIVRLRFPGRGMLDAALDLPFALPTAVAGIALTALTAPNGWLGAPLMAVFGLKVAFTEVGVVFALMFVGLPFIARTVEPVLRDMPLDAEEAAATLGASRAQTLWRVVLPALLPTLLTGFGLAFARAVGEYGSVIFIAGNLPMITEIAPLLIVIRLEQFDYAGAAAVGLAMLALSFVVLLAINMLQRRLRRGRR
ncbi:sulfate ABC transporter permease subunit CysT [Roseomonas populi]|uniref:Sulfate transport system permease protein CysT n=1 Tax=Roseomonas populi TaxID=3121582 RepID=A0ABT1X7E0_9PROT|nr:sulfate ABC transporter permease subunit CysT [Roseomonas pecuniae]MCR0983671.1 sulfate ABC transporter permease subunit CysT [Roseomonas pecuniae]